MFGVQKWLVLESLWLFTLAKTKNNILKRRNRKLSIVIDCIQYEHLTRKTCYKWHVFPFLGKIYMIKYGLKRQLIDNQIPQNMFGKLGFRKIWGLVFLAWGFCLGKNVCASTAEGLFRKKQSKMASILTCNFAISYLILSLAEMSKYTSCKPALMPYPHDQIELGS